MTEKEYVESPFLSQLSAMKQQGLGWDILYLDNFQTAQQTQRENFNQVVMKTNLENALLKINPWLESDQVQEVIDKVLRFEQDNLIQNNEIALNLLHLLQKTAKQASSRLRFF